MSQQSFEVIGRCVLWFLGAGSAVVLFAVASVLFDSWILRPRREAEFARGYQAHVSEISRNSYWFSEHPPTMFLLQRIIKSGIDGMGAPVSQLRDEWRHEMEKERLKRLESEK